MTQAVVRKAAPGLWLLALLLFLGGLLGPSVADAKPRKASTVSAKAGAKSKAAASKAKARKKVAVAKRTVATKKVLAALPAEEPGPLRVSASVAYVMDQETGEVLVGKNEAAVQPIASLTKLMTGLVLAEAQLPMGEKITITDEDVDRLKFSSSRLKVGTELTRAQALHLTLMSSENRAAHALARTYPGGESAFVSAMNVKARQLGMEHTRYVEPTGLSSDNRSSARDLALLTAEAFEHPLLRRYSTSQGYRLATGDRTLQYVNSNGLVRAGSWDIGLQKTGYIREAGYTLLMQAELAGRKLIMVFLDSASKVTRLRDAERVRSWLRTRPEQTAERPRAPG